MKKIGLISLFIVFPTLLLIASYLLGGGLLTFALWVTNKNDLGIAIYIIATPIYLVAVTYIALFSIRIVKFCNIWVLPLGFSFIPLCFYIFETFKSSTGYFLKYTVTREIAFLYSIPFTAISIIVTVVLLTRLKKPAIKNSL